MAASRVTYLDHNATAPVRPAVAAAVAEQARAAGTALAGQEVGFAQGDTMTVSPSGGIGEGHV